MLAAIRAWQVDNTLRNILEEIGQDRPGTA
jgi:hypothetical protein